MLQEHLAPNKNSGKKGPSRGIIQKSEPHERSPSAPKFGERSHEETLHQERCARRVASDLATKKNKLKNADKATFCTPVEARVPKSPEEREFVVESRASMHMMSKKELSSDELDTLRRSRNPTVLHTANDEHMNEKAQENFQDLNLFVTVQFLEETPAFLSLGKLCEDHGYSYEWVRRQKPRVTKEEKTIADKTHNFCTSCCSRVIHQFREQFVVNIDIAGFVFNKSSPRAK